ncbi:radical SAM protein [Lentzea sp. E54]|uniref:radical SAM protein n=1 Tax=Lentzea xerophila TaxID=3435883 RepID=UPI003DA22A57
MVPRKGYRLGTARRRATRFSNVPTAGGATGQRIRAFSRERLRAELELFAKHKVHTIVLCDANFGILPIDAEFIDDMIEVRNQYGYPRALETSWAKNKSKLFFDIVRRMKEAGMRSSFTLALQTLSEDTLKTMNRHNMKVNEWEDLARWLDQEGLDCYAELIWGAPGETVESFMEGYDRLSRHMSIAPLSTVEPQRERKVWGTSAPRVPG